MSDYEDYDTSSLYRDDEYSDEGDGESTSSLDRTELEIALYSQIHFEHIPGDDLTDENLSGVFLDKEVTKVPEEHELNWRERLLGRFTSLSTDELSGKKLIKPTEKKESFSKLTENNKSTKVKVKKEKEEGRTIEKVKKGESRKSDKIKKEKAEQAASKKDLSHLLYRDEPENKVTSLKMKKELKKSSTPKPRVIIVSKGDDSESDSDELLKKAREKKVNLDDLVVVDSISWSDDDCPKKPIKRPKLDSSELDLSRIVPAKDKIGKVKDEDSSDSDESIIEIRPDSSSDESIVEIKPSTSSGDIKTNLTGVTVAVPSREPRSNQPGKNLSLENMDLEDYRNLTIEDIYSSMGECDWSLVRDDKYSGAKSTGGRYFRALDVTCHNCREKGHLSKICPKPRKVAVCLLCGLEGHIARQCSMSVCFNCQRVGHLRQHCPEPSRNFMDWCNRCRLIGHSYVDCTDIWRQYHMTTKSGPLNEVKMKVNRRVFCYNCAREGHWGYECDRDGMDRYWNPQMQFVSKYRLPRSSDSDYQDVLDQLPKRKMKKQKKSKKKAAQLIPHPTQSRKRKKMNKSAFVENAMRSSEIDQSKRKGKKRKTQNEKFEAEYKAMLNQKLNAKKKEKRPPPKKYKTRASVKAKLASVEAKLAGDFQRSKRQDSQGNSEGHNQGHGGGKGDKDQSHSHHKGQYHYHQDIKEERGQKRKWDNGKWETHRYNEKKPRYDEKRSQRKNPQSDHHSQKQKQNKPFTSNRGFRTHFK